MGRPRKSEVGDRRTDRQTHGDIPERVRVLSAFLTRRQCRSEAPLVVAGAGRGTRTPPAPRMVSGARRGEAAPARRAGDRAGVPLTPIHPSGWRNVLSATGIRCPRLARSGDPPPAQTSASRRGSLEPRSPAPLQPPPRPPTKAGRAALTSFPSPGPEDSRLGRGRPF